MFATVAICTWNRAESLRRNLDSLAKMRVPDDLPWEVVVVNNGCTDHTDEVIASYAGRLPIRREYEPRRGISHARNRAVDAAKGEYIVWTDDDTIVDPGWLAAYIGAFRRWPDAAVFGGPIIPRYETPVAEWLQACEHLLRDVYAFRDFGNAPARISPKEGSDPYGANFAVRAAEQRGVRYDPNLGMAAGHDRLGEETGVIIGIFAAGASGYWVPGARVEHCIGRQRQTAAYITRYFAAHGETVALLQRRRQTGPRLFGVPRWMWRRVVEKWISYRTHRMISPAPLWMARLKEYGFAKGQFRYWWNRQAPPTR
jgi:glycosyltransferase involved in cell wall biosynthesis